MIFFPILIFFLTLDFPPAQNSFAQPPSPTTEANVPGKIISEIPIRLRIPAINIDAKIESVGLTEQKVMGVPEGPANAAWFDLGPRPGEIGSAVIDGHFGTIDGISAVFNNLHTLQKGDKIYTEDEKGVPTIFTVRELRTYEEYDSSTEVFHSSDNKAHLNLITCEGQWKDGEQNYSKRLVVFSDILEL